MWIINPLQETLKALPWGQTRYSVLLLTPRGISVQWHMDLVTQTKTAYHFSLMKINDLESVLANTRFWGWQHGCRRLIQENEWANSTYKKWLSAPLTFYWIESRRLEDFLFFLQIYAATEFSVWVQLICIYRTWFRIGYGMVVIQLMLNSQWVIMCV